MTAFDDQPPPDPAPPVGSPPFDAFAAPEYRLVADRSFWGMSATQFLGAFNDNIYKQMLLLLLVSVPTARGDRDLQWIGTFAFSVPFILFSGYAGYLSDRLSKRRVIVLSKVAEIVIMALGAVLFFVYARAGLTTPMIAALCFNLFCMGAQSAFFGPGKYGILPEILPARALPDANGFILMTTFLAIIFGTVVAGELMTSFRQQLWVGGACCIVIAVAGTATSLFVRAVRPASPGLTFDWSTVAVPRDLWDHFRRDRPLLAAVLVSSVFWMAAGIVPMAANALGARQLQLTERATSWLLGTVSIGIALGSVLAGRLSRQRFNTRVMKTGAWGLVAFLLLLALPGANPQRHLLGFYGSLVALVVLGVFTGMFAVPLQVFQQTRPPRALKGRMIATQNLLNWIGIAASALFYHVANRVITALHAPPCALFAATAALMLAVALWYHPREESQLGSADEDHAPATHA